MRCIMMLMTILCIACAADDDKKYSSYFNIESAMRADKAVLYRENAFLVKTVKSNGKTDNIKIKKPDWNLEFELFNKLSISSFDYENRFLADTVYFFPVKEDSSYKCTRVIYKPVDEKRESVKELVVELDENKKVLSFSGITISSDWLTTIKKTYQYIPLKKYKVQAFEDSGVFGTSTYAVEGYIYFAEPYFE